MAKYEDYVKPNLEQEIDEAATGSEERRQEESVPERFKGKSAAEIAQSFEELERLHGRTTNEIGELRRTVKELGEKQSQSEEAARPAPVPVTVDELYDNADGAVRRVAREESQGAQKRIDELERRLQEAESRHTVTEARTRFEAKHTNYKDTVADPAFKAWLAASPVRVQLAMAADAGNFDVADELFSTYAEIQAAKKPAKVVDRKAIKDAGLETSGGSSPTPVDKFSRSELQEMRIRARQGDPKAERWMEAHGADIRKAYAEGRIVN